MTRLQSVIAGIWLAVIALVTTTVASAAPTRLVADLSQSHVDITSGYHGTELLLFGAYEGVPGDELVLIVEGPANDIIQRRKEKRAGVWVNVETLLWKQAPSFYHPVLDRRTRRDRRPAIPSKGGYRPACGRPETGRRR